MPVGEAEIEIVRQIYAAINRNDIAAAVDLFGPQMSWTEPPDFPGGGTHTGRAAVMANLSKGRGSWAEGACEPERFLVACNRIVVFLHALVRLKDRTEWIDGRFADVVTFHDGSPVEVRTFAARQAALEWAGAEG